MAPATPLESPAASANACPRIATRRLARKSTRVRWRAELMSTSLCCPDLTSLHLIASAVEQKRREKTKELVVELQGAATQSERLKLAQLYHEHGAAEVRKGDLWPRLHACSTKTTDSFSPTPHHSSAIDFLAQSQMQGAFPGNVSGAGAADGAIFAPGRLEGRGGACVHVRQEDLTQSRPERAPSRLRSALTF